MAIYRHRRNRKRNLASKQESYLNSKQLLAAELKFRNRNFGNAKSEDEIVLTGKKRLD